MYVNMLKSEGKCKIYMGKKFDCLRKKIEETKIKKKEHGIIEKQIKHQSKHWHIFIYKVFEK